MDFEVGFTDKEITPWGGMALMETDDGLLRHGWSFFRHWICLPRVRIGDTSRRVSSKSFFGERVVRSESFSCTRR